MILVSGFEVAYRAFDECHVVVGSSWVDELRDEVVDHVLSFLHGQCNGGCKRSYHLERVSQFWIFMAA
jgi:hypothetical protein